MAITKRQVEAGPGGAAALRDPVVPARADEVGNLGEHAAEILRLDPVFRPVGLVIVAVHRHQVCVEKVSVSPAVVLKLHEYVVIAESLGELLRVFSPHLVPVKTVGGVAGCVCAVKCDLFVQ